MLKKILPLLFILLFLSCESDTVNNNNPFLPNYSFSINVDLNLPSNANLQFPSNAKYINLNGAGIRGIIVFNTGSGFNAFDAACPNQNLSDCSTMTISGINATCPCDNKSYNLFTGQSEGMQYPMKRYAVEVNGNSLRIFN
ncbi:MAG: Rieske (2Fe-2S) protein [Flavobacterium sp.]|jgi:nitrite reductase/ring-hydroxylating ferredoxin subunit